MARPAQAWLFGPWTDLSVFGGSAVASLAFALWRPGVVDGDTPVWAWLLFVVAIDVAHVWSTLFRTYLDGAEVSRRAALFFAVPAGCYALGVLAYEQSPLWFWRLFAYAALLHFIRQQYGWVALYNRRAGTGAFDHRLDSAAIYAATVGPAVWWHANLPREFWWFVAGDFAPGLPRWVGTLALGVSGAILAAWAARALWLLRAGALQWGKSAAILATAVVWFGGIVLAADDYTFTVTNVVLHGAPYFVLLFRYARARAAEPEGYSVARTLLRLGPLGFLGALVALAFAEEWLWDLLVWHERPGLFGAPIDAADLLPFLVPLLALPQATHYVLDAFIWRGRRDPALLARLGYAVPVSPAAPAAARAA